MPKTYRQMLRRHVAQAHHHITVGAEDVIILEEQFRPVHPEMADYLALIVLGMTQLQEMLGQFSILAWGYKPDDYDAWRNPNASRAQIPDAGDSPDDSPVTEEG